MLEKNKLRGYSKRHSIAVYDKTWENFQDLKEQTGESTDSLLNQFMDQRKLLMELKKTNGLNDMQRKLIASSAVIETDIESIKRHNQEQNEKMQKEIDNIKNKLNSFK